MQYQQVRRARKPKKKAHRSRQVLPLAVAAALAGLQPGAAQALTLTADAAWTVGLLAGSEPTQTATSPPLGAFVDILAFPSDGLGNSAFFHVYGNDSNVFGSRSSGQGNFNALGTFHLSDTITNGGATPFTYFLDYVIDSGDLSVSCGITPCDPAQSGSASYNLAIKVNGGTVESSTATLSIDSSGATLTGPSGFTLDGITSSGIGAGSGSASYSWAQTHRVATLGTFAPGASFTLDYDLVTHAVGNFNVPGLECSGYGGEFPATAGYGGGVCGSAEARSGDPFSIPGIQGGLGVQSAPVPEPATLGLAGLGAAVAGLVHGWRRRRSARSA